MTQASRCAVLLSLFLLCERVVHSFAPIAIISTSTITNAKSALLATKTTTRLFSGMMGGGNSGYGNSGYGNNMNNNQRREEIVAFQVTTVFDQEELLARERDQPMFTSAVRRDIYRILKSPYNPSLGGEDNGRQIFGSVLLAKSSDGAGPNAAWDTFAFAAKGANPSGFTILDDEQMLEAISSIGKITPVALAITQAFEAYLAQLVQLYWAEPEASQLSIEFLVAFGNEMTPRLDINNRIRSTRLVPQEIEILCQQPFANFVDNESLETFQGETMRGMNMDAIRSAPPPEIIPLAGNYGNSDLGMNTRPNTGPAYNPSTNNNNGNINNGNTYGGNNGYNRNPYGSNDPYGQPPPPQQQPPLQNSPYGVPPPPPQQQQPRQNSPYGVPPPPPQQQQPLKNGPYGVPPPQQQQPRQNSPYGVPPPPPQQQQPRQNPPPMQQPGPYSNPNNNNMDFNNRPNDPNGYNNNPPPPSGGRSYGSRGNTYSGSTDDSRNVGRNNNGQVYGNNMPDQGRPLQGNTDGYNYNSNTNNDGFRSNSKLRGYDNRNPNGNDMMNNNGPPYGNGPNNGPNNGSYGNPNDNNSGARYANNSPYANNNNNNNNNQSPPYGDNRGPPPPPPGPPQSAPPNNFGNNMNLNGGTNNNNNNGNNRGGGLNSYGNGLYEDVRRGSKRDNALWDDNPRGNNNNAGDKGWYENF
ncbi:unnamed protein product [Cylindrotheca closterium]|uniref:Uncharacterized protein n=1 Tax=Cylindrotheca closterium TaxID=2856 RepID=A0AAD2CGI6_9STRA|nr:unnamed protein product [Cylindrotheca closterium]